MQIDMNTCVLAFYFDRGMRIQAPLVSVLLAMKAIPHAEVPSLFVACKIKNFFLCSFMLDMGVTVGVQPWSVFCH